MNFVTALLQETADRFAPKIERARMQGRKQVHDDEYPHELILPDSEQ